MLTSKQRAEFRAQANSLETTLMVGKDGVTQAVVEEADRLLTARELVKGKVLETALMSAREVSDAICQATGADGISCVGSKFVIYRYRRNATRPAGPSARRSPRVRRTRWARQPVPAVRPPDRPGNSAINISGSRPLKRPSNGIGSGSFANGRSNQAS